MRTTRAQRVHAAAIIALLASSAYALAQLQPAARAGTGSKSPVALPSWAWPSGGPPPATFSPSFARPAAAQPRSSGPSLLSSTDESGSASVAAPPSRSSGSFGSKYPSQWQAQRQAGVPASNYWALLIGINDYAGSTRDNVGSYQDARDLRSYLLSLGWMSDHIVLIANRDATAARVIQGIRWLAAKTDSSSVAVFHYSGHENFRHTTSDGDNEARDVALWVADNKLILDGTLGREMGRVRASRMWIDLAVCRAGGFNDAGMMGHGRVLTFSSPENELSYEDPNTHHSVFGWYMIVEAMQGRRGDRNGDGRVTVEEAFVYARPNVVGRSGGAQHPAMWDGAPGDLFLVPPAPPSPPEGDPNPQPTDCGLIFC